MAGRRRDFSVSMMTTVEGSRVMTIDKEVFVTAYEGFLVCMSDGTVYFI